MTALAVLLVVLIAAPSFPSLALLFALVVVAAFAYEMRSDQWWGGER